MSEDVVTFGTNRTLVGILHRPDRSVATRSDLPAVLFLNAGILHRVGPNRVYVRMAREFEKLGFHVLRFDVWGIGDSQDEGGAGQGRTFVDDTREAMKWLHQHVGANRFMLVGICMGARIALEVARREACVESLVLMEGIYLKSARYHLSRMLDPGKWKRVLTGQNHKMKQLRKMAARLLGRKKATKPPGSRPVLLLDAGDTSDMRHKLNALLDRGTKILLAFRDGNETAHNYSLRREGDAITAMGTRAGLQVSFIRFADHTFTPLVSQDLLLDVITRWLSESYRSGQIPLEIAA